MEKSFHTKAGKRKHRDRKGRDHAIVIKEIKC
jgi:hypothetical protein